MEPTEINLPPGSGESKEIILKEEAQYFLDITGARAISGYGSTYNKIAVNPEPIKPIIPKNRAHCPAFCK